MANTAHSSRAHPAAQGCYAAAAALAIGCGEVEVSFLTYNVAGLPEGISASSPATNSPIIGGLIGDYDVVLLQEDFVYHAEIATEAEHPYRLPPAVPSGDRILVASGLSRFSRHPLSRVHQERWQECHGLVSDSSDCLAPKGFAVAEHTMDLGGTRVAVDIYDVHLDAGGSEADRAARAAQVAQLTATIVSRSERYAVIVAGDFNIDDPRDPLLQDLREQAGLLDTCIELSCDEPGVIDRVLYRSSKWVMLQPTAWRVPGEFVDDRGAPLSDHRPVAVDFRVGVQPQGQVSSPLAEWLARHRVLE